MRYVECWSLALLCVLNVVACASTNVHTRAEIDARHVGAIHSDWEVVPLLNIGTNRTSIAARLGEPYPVAIRVFAEDGTYSDTYATYEAWWRVTYSRDDHPLKIERALIVKDAAANKAPEDTARKLADPQR